MRKIYIAILFIIATVITTANTESYEIVGPKAEVEASLGINFLTLEGSVAVKPNWNKKLSSNTSVDFGPKITLTQMVTFIPAFNYKPDFSPVGATKLNFGFNSEFNFLENKPERMYIGLEAGIGVIVAYVNDGEKINFKTNLDGIGKLSAGAKIKNHKIGGYLGYGKGILGVEYGYTFEK